MVSMINGFNIDVVSSLLLNESGLNRVSNISPTNSNSKPIPVFLGIKKMKCEPDLIQTLVLSNTLLVKYSQAFISPEMLMIQPHTSGKHVCYFPIGDSAVAEITKAYWILFDCQVCKLPNCKKLII